MRERRRGDPAECGQTGFAMCIASRFGDFTNHRLSFWMEHTVPRKPHASYLGATLTDSVDNHKEIMQRLCAVNATALQLQPFWSQTCTTVKWRLRVFEAALSTKLLYGLETLQLTRSEQNTSLDAFQLKMLRRIPKGTGTQHLH